MNSRLFLYSSLFFVLILLFDRTNQTDLESVNKQDAMPQTKVQSPEKNNISNMSVPKDVVQKAYRDISVMTDTLDLKINMEDGSIVSTSLIKYAEKFGDKQNKVKLLNNGNLPYIAKADIQSNDSQTPTGYTSDRNIYRLLGNDTLSVTLKSVLENKATVTKKYTFSKNSHSIKLEQTVTNVSSADSSWRAYNLLERVRPPEESSMLYTFTGAAYYDENDKFNKIEFSDIEDNNLLKETSGGWISMIQHYFFTAWIPENSITKQTVYTRSFTADNEKRYLIGTVGEYVTIKKNESVTFTSVLFVGPKKQSEIAAITPGLDLTVDYGVLTFLAAPLFWVLNKINLLFGNWGWSIIALTFLIKLVFFKLSETSYKSMAKMKKLTPRMTALKERYGEDRKKFSEALMKIYKEEKVNPLGGCLPILIQIPVFIALYWVIIESVEMRHAPFIGWVADLSSADPYFILPILMGASMYIQQKLNPAPTDAMQQKIFMALPFIFTFLFATFPSGLVLYWLTNNVLSIGQQYVINKRTLA